SLSLYSAPLSTSPLSLHDALPISTLQFLDLIEEALFKALLRFVVLLPHRLDFSHQLVVRRCKHPPLRPRMLVEHRARDLGECLRSEEHTSELQSRENLVCRLLLEK